MRALARMLRYSRLYVLLAAAAFSPSLWALSVSLTAPTNYAVFAAGANVAVSATAIPSTGRPITKVEFFTGGGTTLIGTATSAPYSITWSSVPAGRYAIRARATDSSGAVRLSAARSIRVDAAPVLSLVAPVDGAIFAAGASIALRATASDTVGRIVKVDFYQGSTLIGSDTNSPYRVIWPNVAAGIYVLSAVATNDAGMTTTSSAVNVRVQAGTAPVVSLTAPANNTVYASPAIVTLTANASVSGGTIAKVDYFRGGNTLIGTATTAPYTFNWTNVAAGNYSLTAVATSNGGASATSSAVSIRVDAAPAVSLTAPVNNALYASPGNVTLTANATDSVGTITKVDFFRGGSTLIGTATASPYTINWTSVPAGAYSLTAVATNDAAMTATSSAINIIVNTAPTVSLTSPTNNANFTTPASVTLSALAQDSDGTIAKVEFFTGPTLIVALTTPPYSYDWSNVLQGSYTLTARATDNLGATATSDIVAVSVGAASKQVYYIDTDHLNTPRLVSDDQQQTRWRWDQAEPFGVNVPDENPSGLGAFEFNLRFPGQYVDMETGLNYNGFRDFDPILGIYKQSDLIGLFAGLNTYAYAISNPIGFSDDFGLDVTIKYFPPFPPGHIGMAINSEDTVGMYPRLHREAVNACKSIPGAVLHDKVGQSPEEYRRASVLRIKTTAAQDRIIQRRLDIAAENPESYNWCSYQCSSFVLNTLRAGGVAGPEGTFMRPDSLFDALEKMYLRK